MGDIMMEGTLIYVFGSRMTEPRIVWKRICSRPEKSQRQEIVDLSRLERS